MRKLNALITIATLVAAGGSWAQSPTREEVVAELQRARASGELAAMNSEDIASFGQVPLSPRPILAQRKTEPKAQPKADQPAAVPKTRAEVVSELQRARASGELESQYSEAGPGYFPARRSAQPADPLLAGKNDAKFN